MNGYKVHFEVYVRKIPGAPWVLNQATENRATALEAGNALMAEGKVAAVRVTKETYDEEAREYRAITILKLGSADTPARSKPKGDDSQPLCVTPQDLYSVHARERIGRLLEGWLERNHATPFELLHRPDLVERLEASGTDLLHALQKLSIPEAHARNTSVHAMMRTFQALVERAVERLMKDHRKGLFPTLDVEGFARTAERLASEPERAYLLGAGVAAAIAPARTWGEKVEYLLDLADAAPKSGPARALALATVQQPLAEILETKPGVADVLGRGRDLGANLAAMTRLAAVDAVESLIRVERHVAAVMPELSPMAARLATWLSGDTFQATRSAIGRRILRELTGHRRLRPGDAAGEIQVLRALGMTLTAAAGKLLPLEDVQAAFATRSRMLVTGDFVEAYLGQDMSSRQEVEALIWLTENIIGPANKRQAGGWLKTTINSLRFEKDMVEASDSAAGRLAQLAHLQRQVGRCGLVEEDYKPLQDKLGELGGAVDARGRISQGLAKAAAPPLQKLTLLLRLAVGESAPLGPAANRARTEALRLIKQDDTRAALAASPEHVEQVRELFLQAGVAA